MMFHFTMNRTMIVGVACGVLVVISLVSLRTFGLQLESLQLSNCDCTNNKASLTFEGSKNRASMNSTYIPSPVEKYSVEHADSLGYNASSNQALKPTCSLWTDSSKYPFHDSLMQYREELANYTRRINEFQPVPDLRQSLLKDNNHDVCDTLELVPGGLRTMFPSQLLSYSSSFGAIEPLVTPMRHPNFCFDGPNELMNLEYMVHDFSRMCQRLKPTSRLILVDMGASLEFHPVSNQPALFILDLYRKFGFHFDHVYAYEVKNIAPDKVFAKIPQTLQASYHWINVGVEADPNSNRNPLKMILENYNEDDFIVVKLDIDTSFIEIPLARQLLEDNRYSALIDQFYFEHHVFLKELAPYWKTSMNGTLSGSLELFKSLREKGIAAHSWV